MAVVITLVTQGGTAGAQSDPELIPCTPIPGVDDRCEEWVGPRVDGPGRGPDGPGGPDVADPTGVSPDGKVFYTVGIADMDASANQDLDMMTVATDAETGATRWKAIISGDRPHLLGVALSVDLLGRYVFVTGRGGADSYNPCTMTTAAYDALTGSLVWVRSIGSDAGDCVHFQALGVDPSGARLYLAASRKATSGTHRWSVFAYGATNGAVLWGDEYVGALDAGAVASALDVSADGTLYVGGSSLGRYYGSALPMSWVTIAYSAESGQRRWLHSSPTMTNSRPMGGVKVSPDGSHVFVVGSGRLADARSFDIVVTSLDSTTGDQEWMNYYNGPGPNNQNFDGLGAGSSIVVTPDGSKVIVTGFSNSVTGVGIDLATAAFEGSSGRALWATRQAEEYWQYWSPSIVMAPDGSRVYVGGLAAPKDSFNSFLPTIAYDTSTGAKAWMARYQTGYQYWGGMSISPDGSRLFVAGAHASWASPGVSNSYDFFSVAYRT